jgi:hypothetical protein
VEPAPWPTPSQAIDGEIADEPLAEPGPCIQKVGIAHAFAEFVRSPRLTVRVEVRISGPGA